MGRKYDTDLEEKMKEFNFWFGTVIRLGALGFWVAAMLTMPDSVPGYVNLFMMFVLWSFIALHSDINYRK